jgi:colanic acid/amylovoran biosynthesis glycosyltransferase
MPEPRPAKIAYLVNQYPQTSHTFIRREIAAIEATGLEVDRYTIRPVTDPAVDEADEAERARTRVVLGVGRLGLLAAATRAAFARPLRWLRAARAAVRVGRRSDRGVAVHLVYLAEACVLREWLARSGTRHVHAHFGTNSATVAMLCRLLGGPPYSFTAHGPEEFDAPRTFSLEEKVRHAAFAVGVSEFGRAQLCRWSDHADWGKIHVVRCGVDGSFLDEGSSPIPTAPRLVCVGRLAEQKGQIVLIEAAGVLKDRGLEFELILVGDGPMRPAIERRIADLGLERHVHLAGWGDGRAVRQAIVDSRALVLPSYAEGLPVVLMEALALGRPVISTYIAGIPELVAPGECGWLVPAGAVKLLATAMAEALEADVADLRRMGLAGAARVAARHDASAEAARLVSLIGGSAVAGRRAMMRKPDDDEEIVAARSAAC